MSAHQQYDYDSSCNATECCGYSVGNAGVVFGVIGVTDLFEDAGEERGGHGCESYDRGLEAQTASNAAYYEGDADTNSEVLYLVDSRHTGFLPCGMLNAGREEVNRRKKVFDRFR